MRKKKNPPVKRRTAEDWDRLQASLESWREAHQRENLLRTQAQTNLADLGNAAKKLAQENMGLRAILVGIRAMLGKADEAGSTRNDSDD